jgi:spermidine synthase
MLGTKILEEKESRYNGHLKVVNTWGMGTYIQAEGLTQSGGIVEDIWKQTLNKIHRSQFTVHNSLILGLGGGTVANLIRKNWSAATITGVDIDPAIVDLGKKYLGLCDAGVKIEIADASDFLTRNSSPLTHSFDLIIVDMYQGDSVPKKVQTQYYMHLVSSLLSRSGIAVFNRLYFKKKREETIKFGRKLESVFKRVEKFYPTTNLMFFCRK